MPYRINLKLRLLLPAILSCHLMAADSDDPTLWTYDLTGTLAVDCSDARQVRHTWDEAHCVAALQDNPVEFGETARYSSSNLVNSHLCH